MLDKVGTLKGYTLKSRDGEIGKVLEFYFDDRHWTIRYLVADTGNWLRGRLVLISPYALGAVRRDEKQLVVDLTRKQIEDSPALDSDKPVSRQFEDVFYGYYGWPVYWGGPAMWGLYPTIERDPAIWREAAPHEKAWDPHLRSTREVSGYAIHAADGAIGHVSDFVIDDKTWAIRYLIVNTTNWWPGQKVLVSPQWIERISWDESQVFVSLSRQAIQASPRYTEASLLTRDDEIGLHRHYNRQGYWEVAPPTAKGRST